MESEYRIMKNVMRIAANSRRTYHNASHKYSHGCRGFGHILDLLSKKDGLTQHEIAEAVGIRPQSASEAIAGMEAQGLVVKKANEQDRRSSLVFITENGKIRQVELLNERQQNARRIFAPLNEDEKTVLLDLLEKVTTALQESKEET